MDSFLIGKRKADATDNTSRSLQKPGQIRIMPWIEKYRPAKVNDIAYQTEVVAVLKKCVEGKEIPNLLFYGPPGTGKTSSILAFAKEIFGMEAYRDRVLELNASDERGIQVIRDKVKTFAQFAAGPFRPDGKPCPPLKLIILDEADSMTSAAQSALRRTMEKESRTTRFCLICNYISRIIEPITSRCAKFRFKPLTLDSQMICLKQICAKEDVLIDDNALRAIVEVCEGDLRRAITSLQSASKFKSQTSITVEDINELSGIIPETLFESFLTACRKNRYELLDQSVSVLQRSGYSAYQLMIQLHDFLLNEDDPMINDKFKAKIFEKIAFCEFRLINGADEYLQLIDLGCAIMLAYKVSASG